MTFEATGVRVMLSGPGDTREEIASVRQVIESWNRSHAVDRRLFFTAEHFDDAVPVYTRSADGQAVINEQITSNADIVVCVFKHRLGTPTPRNEHSGTVEEADLREADARVHMYFWAGDALPMSITEDDQQMEQWQKLKQFRRQVEDEKRGLYGTYRLPEDLASQVESALWKFVNAQPPAPSPAFSAANSPTSQIALDVRPVGAVWRLPVLDRWIEVFIESDTKEEKDWAEANASVGRSSISGLQGTLGTPYPGWVQRKPRSENEIEAWADDVRDGYHEFDDAIAAAAAPGFSFEVEAGARLEGLEIEIVVEDAHVVDRTAERWSDIWTPLYEPPQDPLASAIARSSISMAMPINFHSDCSAENKGAEVLVTIDAGEVRRPTSRIPAFELDEVLMVPWDSTATQLKYRWFASASNVDQEWSGEGTIEVIDGARAQDALIHWYGDTED